MTGNKWHQWLIFSFVTIIAFLGVIGWHNGILAQETPTQATPTTDEISLERAQLDLKQVGTDVYALIANTDFPQEDKKIAICNGGIVIGDDGVLVIDPFQSPQLADLLFDAVAELTDKPIKYVLNTHFHFDHTGGNAAAEAKGIPVIGRGEIRELMLAKNTTQDPNLTPPNLILNDDGNIWLGDRQIHIQPLEGHSGGTDIIAYIPDANIIFAGDLLFNERFPYIADGSIKKWQATLTTMMETYPDAIFVPGHGKITDLRGIETFKRYLDDLEELALSWKQQSLDKEAAITSASEIPSAYRNYKFQALYPSNLNTAYEQITASN